MTDELDRLEELAAKATPGPWKWTAAKRVSEMNAGRTIVDARYRNGDKDAAYIAALDPSTVLALIADARLGAAWTEAEAALPEGDGDWLEIEGPHDAPDEGKYTVKALHWTRVPADSHRLSEIVVIAKVIDTPTAALLALRDALRERGT